MAISSKSLREWKERVRVAKKIHEERVEKPVNKNREYYRGNQWSDDSTSRWYHDKTVDNMVFSNISSILPSILLLNPKIFVSPRNKPRRTREGLFNTIQAAILLEMLVNYDIRELNLKRQWRMALVDALIGCDGYVRLGYTAQTEKFQTKNNKDGKTMIEEHELIRGGNVFAVRGSPMDLIRDPKSKDHFLEDAGWIGLRWVKPLNDVKNHPKYKNTKNLKANFPLNIDAIAKANVDMGNEIIDSQESGIWDEVVGWDIWDRKNGTLITLVENHDKVLREETSWPLELEGFPVEMLYFNENPDDPYPVSDVSIYQSAQDELNRVRSMHLDHIRRISRRKFIQKEGVLDEEEIYKLTHGPDGTIVTAQKSGNLADSFMAIPDASVSQDIYVTINSMRGAIREQSGIAQFEKGVGQKFDTATEPALIAQGVSIKRQERAAIVEDFITRTVRKLMQIRQQTMDEEISIGITNEQAVLAQSVGLDQEPASKLEKLTGAGGEQILLPWIRMNKNDIKGEFDFTVEVGSTQPKDENTRKQNANMLAQMAGSNPLIDRTIGTRLWLEAFGFMDDGLMRNPQEVAAEQQQAQSEQLQAQMAEPQLKTQTDLQKTQMKTQTAITRTALDNETKKMVANMGARSKALSTLVGALRGNGNASSTDKKNGA